MMLRTIRGWSLPAAMIVLAACMGINTVHATQWNNAGGGSFTDGGNWLGGSPPGSDDWAVHELDSAGYTVTFPGDAAIRGVNLGNDIVTFDLASHSLNLTSDLRLGSVIDSGHRGELTVGLGTINADTVRVGDDQGTSGKLTLNGTSINSVGIQVGHRGDAELYANNAAVTTNVTTTAVTAGLTTDLQISGGTWTNQATFGVSFDIALRGAGDFTLKDGAVLNNMAASRICDANTASSNVTVTGDGTRWDNAQDLAIGLHGPTTMTISDKAVVNTGESIFGTTLGGGTDGSADVSVLSGAKFNNSKRLGIYRGSSLTVDGMDSSLSIGAYSNIGGSGTGVLTVRNLAHFQADNTISISGYNGVGSFTLESNATATTQGINAGNDSTLTVDHAQWDINNVAYQLGNNTVWHVQNTAAVMIKGDQPGPFNGGRLFLGANDVGSSATLNINTAGSVYVQHDLFVSPFSEPGSIGRINIDGNNSYLHVSRGIVELGGFTWPGSGTSYQGGTAEVNIDHQGFFRAGVTTRIYPDATVNVLGGSMAVGSAARQVPGVLRIASNGTVYCAGTINANILNSGTFHPGLSPGTATIQGDFDMLADANGVPALPGDFGQVGKLIMEITGPAGGQYDRLVVNGTFHAGGIMELIFTDSPPLIGQTYELLNFQQFQGSFDQVLIRGLRPGWTYEPIFDTQTLTILSLSDAVLIPEPSTLRWLLLPVLMLMLRRGRANHAAKRGG